MASEALDDWARLLIAEGDEPGRPCTPMRLEPPSGRQDDHVADRRDLRVAALAPDFPAAGATA